MNGIAYHQILILLFQCLIVATLILSLFRLRSIFGLSLLFTALGVFQFLQVYIYNTIYFEITSDILVSPGTIVFTGSIFAILLIYIREDALEARKIIYAILAANLVLSFMQFVISWGIESDAVLNVYNLPKKFFTQEIRAMIVGTIALIIDAFIVIFIYETISRYVSVLFLRIFFSMAIVLSIDSLIFNLGILNGTDQFLNRLISHLTAKISSAFVYSILFTIYLTYFEKKSIKSESKSHAFNDIFSMLTYRQKYEQVSTEKKQLDEQFKEKELQFQTIFEKARNVIYVISKEGKFTSINPAFEELTGWSVKEWINQPFTKIVHPDDLHLAMQSFKRILEEKEVKPYEMRILCKSGEYVIGEFTPALLKSKNNNIGILGIAMDITDRIKDKESLKKSEKRFKTIFEEAPLGIALIESLTGRFYDVNPFFIRILGRSKEEIENIDWMSITHPDDIQEDKDKMAKMNAGTTQKFNMKKRYFLPNGSIVWVNMTIAPFPSEDKTKPLHLSMIEDITELKEKEEELKQYHFNLENIVKERTKALENSEGALLNLVDDLNIQSKKLEISNKQFAQINEELETFTYSVSHDLKAPLRGIDGYSQLLLENYKEDLNSEAQEFLMNIRNSTERMNLLIEDLLAYSRMERRDFQITSIYLNPIVDNILHQFSKVIQENQVEIDISIPEEFKLIADKEGLQLVLRNLIDNAIKFSKTNKKSKIEIGGDENDSFWHIFVKDNGIGFDMKYHDRIFKIFQRLHLAEEYEGTGIGLVMVHKAMYRMNGKVWAESKLNEGSCFHLEINKTI
jgi:PAS domain S-box-containing protein